MGSVRAKCVVEWEGEAGDAVAVNTMGDRVRELSLCTRPDPTRCAGHSWHEPVALMDAEVQVAVERTCQRKTAESVQCAALNAYEQNSKLGMWRTLGVLWAISGISSALGPDVPDVGLP